MWRHEPPEVKNAYKLLSEQQSRIHRLVHPEYKFKPRKCIAKRKKRGPGGAALHGSGSRGEGETLSGSSSMSDLDQASLTPGATPSAPSSPETYPGFWPGLDSDFTSYLAGIET
ncbi:hypothetical protein HK104_008039, partial [Borealophlyctis nickersoniae]